jgi:hypothetical protein
MQTIPLKTSDPKWAIFMASLAVLTILVLFHSVVVEAAKAGELRRQATAAQRTATLHCSALRDVNELTSCIRGLKAPVPTGEPTLLAAK